MNEAVHNYIRTKKIDSFQKLRLLLFLHRHPHMRVSSQELAHRLHLGDTLLIETILADLRQSGLVTQMGNNYQLPDEPELKLYLQQLASAFEHPVTRQELLKQVKPTRVPAPL
ncbi:MAG: Rrf2 family transcriptional regulator [Anaerolineales bacterium]|nr:Rrf2 family transcriptional regulator [Anaerolineales bacterium]